MGLEQSPAYLSKGLNSRNRARSVSQPRSGSGRNSLRPRERSRERSTSPYCTRTQRVPPGRRDSRSASKDRGRSRSPSVLRVCSDPIWKRRMRTMPVEHSKFIWDIVSYISNLKAFFDFAIGCGIPSHIVRKAIEDNDPSDDDISLEDCVVQALTIWWISSNRPAIWKSEKIKQGFVGLHMPESYACLIKRHPTLDPTPPEPIPQNGPQPGTSGQMSPRPRKYLSLESIALKLISTEYDFPRELSCLIQTPENAYGLVCIRNLPDETFVYIRREHTRFGLSVKEIQSRIAFHVLAIWYLHAKGKFHIIPMLRDMFHDLESEDGCTEVIDRFPGVVNMVTNSKQNFPSQIKMGTKALKKGKKSKVAASQSNCSSMQPLHSIKENGEIMDVDMEEQMPELVDTSDNKMPELVDNSDNEISSTRENLQGTTTENQSVRVHLKMKILEIFLQTHKYS